MIQKINRLSLVEQVAEQMEQLIEQGQWKVGEKLPPEMELMDKFGVSRNTLREAIRALVHAGLLETKQGSGTLVRSTSVLGAALKRHVKKSTMMETLEVRFALEKQAAKMAAERRTEGDLAKLEASVSETKVASEKEDIDQFITSDIEFHKAIVQASGNQLLIDLYEHMTDLLYSFVHDFLAMQPSFQLEQGLHLNLLDAIQKQDQASAAMYVENDMEVLKDYILKMTEE
ncbi:FadR/GntR family transcriptional regulator [Allobacillus halotolerans]|uniref:FadR family transcriptional regulator n=1 Tax=Allobacillus halotolerans TaxID=570278 RepID=A0ABS6GLF0_9BACI|nr:FadR/GntR family transcriptional regulator [Allobacillus halotolerans]MBU6079980.1 FadR family transcriptional regulator [Allobacillus halotolerans]